jgi:hypothetical protein
VNQSKVSSCMKTPKLLSEIPSRSFRFIGASPYDDRDTSHFSESMTRYGKFFRMLRHLETSFTMTTYHHHEILVNGLPLRCNDSQISLCVEECKRSFDPIDQQACVQAVEARWAPYSNCFSSEMTVMVRGSRESVPLRNLKEDDEVLDRDLQYVKVVGWLHRDDTIDAVFIVIHHETGTLLTTADHLLFDPSQQAYVPADTVRAVETLFCDGTLVVSKVKQVTKAVSRGVYAPLTTSGTLMVSGVHVSCFTSPQSISFPVSHELGQMATLPYRWNSATTSLVPLGDFCRTLYNIFAVH